MSVASMLKNIKPGEAESGDGFDPPAIPFIPVKSSLKTESSQEFSLSVTPDQKKKSSTYKFKAPTFANGSPEDLLEWEKS